MSDPSLLVLASSADGEKHGYAMMLDIKIGGSLMQSPVPDAGIWRNRWRVWIVSSRPG